MISRLGLFVAIASCLATLACSASGTAPAKPTAVAAATKTPPKPAPPPRAPAPATSVAVDATVEPAPEGTPAASADTWKAPEAGEVLATVPMKLVRGLQQLEQQPRMLNGQLSAITPDNTDVSLLGGGQWFYGIVRVTSTESVPFAVMNDRSILVFDSNRDGILNPSERVESAGTYGAIAWFEPDVPVRQSVGGRTMQCRVPVRLGVALSNPHYMSFVDARREGVVSAGGKDVRIAIVDHTFRGWFGHQGLDALYVDVDGDGAFDGAPDSAERYRLGDPFPLPGGDAVLTSVAPFGSQVTVARSLKAAVRKASLRPGSPAPTFTATAIDGKAIDLEKLRGKWVMLDFWATWCGPCRNELPNVIELHRRNPDLVIIGVTGDDTPEPVAAFTQAHGMDWAQVHAQARPVMKQYRVASFPTSFLIAPDGTIAGRDLRGPTLPDQFAKLKQAFASKRG